MKSLNAKHLIVIAVATTALIAAGCGEDDSSEPPLTKEEFITQADQICAESDQALTQAAQDEFGTSGAQPPREDQEAFISSVVAPELADQREQIAALNPPEEDSEQIGELLSALEELAAEAESNPGSVLEGEQTQAAELAGAYGFTVCGN